MAEKKCKHCAMMIPGAAKICPYCRKKQGSSMAALWLIGLIVLLFGYTCSHMDSSTTASSVQAPAAPQEVALTEKGKKVKQKHSSWSNDICNTVAEKKIMVGMTTDQVRSAWGKPYRINTSTGSYGEHEQWVMSDGIGSDYVYFENGIMTSLQQSK